MVATKRALYDVALKADGDRGQVEALVSVFGNVDLQGDRVVKGAFKNSIAAWKESGDPIPVIFSHAWGDPFSHIGKVDDIAETAKGLKVDYTLDIADNPVAAQIYRLMKRRTIKEHSFAYEIVDEHAAKDGANELLDLNIIEVGPTLKGANPDTELLAVKSLLEDEAQWREMFGMKVGRRLSAATRSEVQAIHDHFENGVARIRTLLAADVAEEDDGEDDAAADDDEKSVDVDTEISSADDALDTDLDASDREPEAKSDDDEHERTDDDNDREPEAKSVADPVLLILKTSLEQAAHSMERFRNGTDGT